MNSISFHRRNLPHYYQPNSTYFVTFRIKDSIPLNDLRKLNEKFDDLRIKSKINSSEINNNYFIEYDNLLHSNDLCKYLNNNDLANIVKTEIHNLDSKEFNLICYSIMPNHVHLIFHILNDFPDIGKIMQTIKRISAYRINKLLNKSGSFWQAESYDHIIRDENELNKLIEYTLLNPVKVMLVENWNDFEHNYLSEYW